VSKHGAADDKQREHDSSCRGEINSHVRREQQRRWHVRGLVDKSALMERQRTLTAQRELEYAATSRRASTYTTRLQLSDGVRQSV
jgi:Uri superfamily endonuclease